jgi:hypothetical protein
MTAIDGDAHAVLLSAGTVYRVLPLAETVDGAEAISVPGGHLEVEAVGSLAHLLSQARGQHRGASLHEKLHLLEQGRVPCRVDSALARSGTAFDVIVEAHVTATEDLVAAGAKREDGAQ